MPINVLVVVRSLYTHFDYILLLISSMLSLLLIISILSTTNSRNTPILINRLGSNIDGSKLISLKN